MSCIDCENLRNMPIDEEKENDKSFNKKILNCCQKKTPKPFHPLDPNYHSHKYEKKKKKKNYLAEDTKVNKNQMKKINNK